ncbi:hypothetical protein [Hymenobacter negativus]|uniref:Auto-transporter adhesin head GIN domain-containing protein n=1 Tax=Hymenobacter negativus TaxID=2795026 RepID=A0ABS3QJM2_9BACT|nr:hypothetical protein [Hymenobacter negativus]MBO2011444.1 hypothetical protein [Hymenobacter negativus]
MKTSNKLLVAALALVLGTVASYDVALRAEYLTGRYKDPLQNYTKQPNTGFDAVEVPAGLYFKVRIEAGPAGVWVNKDAAEYVRFRQNGRTLAVTLAQPEEEHFLGGREAVVIHCPQLQQLTTDSPYSAARRKAHQGQPSGEVLVRNFNQDSLRVDQRWAGTVKLESNNLRQLRAVAGASVGSAPALEVAGSNNIQGADLAINHQSRLDLKTQIPQLRYHFSDSATVTFGGTAASALTR